MSFIVEGMSFQSLSGIVVAAIIVVVLAGLVPRNTMKGLKNASRHTQDKYSASLRVIEDESYAGKDNQNSRESVIQKSYITEEHINRVRVLRKAGIRRRRVLVSLLIVASIIVTVCAWYFAFSFAYVAIPVALLGVVLALGIRANASARAWERKIKQSGMISQKGSVYAFQSVTRGASDTDSHGISEENAADHTPLRFAIDDVNTVQFARVDKSSEESSPTVSSEVHSREIVSVKQVAQAVPPKQPVVIPANDMQAENAQGAEKQDKSYESIALDKILEMRR